MSSWYYPYLAVFITFLISFYVINFTPSFSDILLATVVAFFLSSVIYGYFIKGGNGAPHTVGQRGISSEARTYIIFFIAILISSLLSGFLSNFIVNGYILPNTNHTANNIILSGFLSLGLFLGMRFMFYQGNVINKTTLVLIISFTIFVLALLFK